MTLRSALTTFAAGPFGDDFAAAHAGAGAEVDDVVGRPHRVFVVLDHHHRVAHVAQPGQRVEQAVVVARMQADRRFVENVQHADQPAADLSGQANALRFAAGERRRGAVEREVVEPDVHQEAEPAADFLQHLGGDERPRVVEHQIAEELDRVAHRQVADFRQSSATFARRTLRSRW